MKNGKKFSEVVWEILLTTAVLVVIFSIMYFKF